MAETPQLMLLDLQLPDATGWWPPAPGWWLLAAVLIALILAWPRYRRWYKQPGKRQFRSAALAELEQYYQHYQHPQYHHQDNQQHPTDPNASLLFIQQVSALLKRVALINHDPARVARLNGEDWADFLTHSQNEVCRRDIRTLLSAGYSTQQTALDATPLYHFARHWLASKEAFPS